MQRRVPSPEVIVNLAKAMRTTGFGALSVILAIYLRDHKFSEVAIGAVLSATLVEDALFTVSSALLVRKLGMRAVLIGASLLITLCGFTLMFDCPQWLIVTALVFGIVSPSGFEGGPFAAIEQSVIAQNSKSQDLTRAYSNYNLWGFGGAAGGALLAGLVSGSSQLIFALYAASGLILAWLYLMLALPSDKPIEQKNSFFKVMQPENVDKTHLRYAYWLAGLQCIDAFGGGFITQSILSYWFVMRFHADATFLGYLFFAANVLAAVSFWAAPFIARRFGLLATMVFTHLPCSMTLCLMPFLPTAGLAAALILVRSLFSSMDIPARQAYTMLLVRAEDRPYAAALTTSARSLAQAFAPIFSGWSLGNVVYALPFVYAGTLKSIYDVAMFVRFSGVPLSSQALSQDFQASKLVVTKQSG